MIRATTPTFTLTLSESSAVDLTEASKVFFTISQGSTAITKQVTPKDARTVEVFLTQAESLSLKDGKAAEIQINLLWSAGNRSASKVKSVKVDKQLLKEVIS